jgi:DNA-binding CsgD family transcriptional regulator
MIVTNGKGTAGHQKHDPALPEGASAFVRVPGWPPDGTTPKLTSRAWPKRPCQPANERQCRELLETVINLLQALLAYNLGRAEAQGGSKPAHLKETCVRLAVQRYGLTVRENQVLAEMVDGRSNRQIATTLMISVSTVKTHVSNIISKMGAESRTKAVALTLE